MNTTGADVCAGRIVGAWDAYASGGGPDARKQYHQLGLWLSRLQDALRHSGRDMASSRLLVAWETGLAVYYGGSLK
ncbi:MAG: hypothetical protein ACRD4Q_00760 [Candidatus Acidiferrales bacterium]